MEAEINLTDTSSLLTGQSLDEQLLARSEDWDSRYSDQILKVIYASLISSISEGFEHEIKLVELDTSTETENLHSEDDLAKNVINTVTSIFPHYCDQHPEWQEHNSLVRFIYITYDGINNGLENAERILDSANLLDDSHCDLLVGLREACHLRLDEFSEGFGFNEDTSLERITEDFYDEDEEGFIDDSMLDKLLS